VVVITCLLGLSASWIIDVAPLAELFLAHRQNRGTEDQRILADGAVGVAPELASRPSTPEQSAVHAYKRATNRHSSAQRGRCRDRAASMAPPPAARTNRDELDWDQPALSPVQLIAHRLAGNEQCRYAAGKWRPEPRRV